MAAASSLVGMVVVAMRRGALVAGQVRRRLVAGRPVGSAAAARGGLMVWTNTWN